MTDPLPEPPRVRVTLPGGRVVDGLLLGWRQDPDGGWVPAVAIEVPAGAVTRVAGEDYSQVPRTPAGPRYVVQRMAPLNGKPRRELHTGNCWMYTRDPLLTTPVDTAEEAADLIREGAIACEVCRPKP